MRIIEHPILGTLKQEKTTIHFNGVAYPALKGDSIAAALLANDIRVLRYTHGKNQPRGIYCGIGHCYECRVFINGEKSVRACIAQVEPDMYIQSTKSRVFK